MCTAKEPTFFISTNLVSLQLETRVSQIGSSVQNVVFYSKPASTNRYFQMPNAGLILVSLFWGNNDFASRPRSLSCIEFEMAQNLGARAPAEQHDRK